MNDAPGPLTAASGEGKLVIKISPDEHQVNDMAEAALSVHPETYQRGGELVRVLREPARPSQSVRPEEGPRISPIPGSIVREMLTLVAEFSAPGKKGQWDRVPPPAWCVQALLDRARYEHVRRLRGVVEHPILRSDGSILGCPGYDEPTGMFYAPAQSRPLVDVPSGKPSKDDAVNAVADLREAVCDFPFAGPEAFATWVSALLTPLCRYAFDGPAPMHAVDGNLRGVGKGKLIDVIGGIVIGRDVPKIAYNPDDVEMAKVITAFALAGGTLVNFDNIEAPLGTASLNVLLTEREWSGRILGESRTVTVPVSMSTFATGNNIRFRGDFSRRVLGIRLDSATDRPEARTGFRHPNLEIWVRDNRERLVIAALTIPAAYFAAGCPGQGLSGFGSYDAWGAIVRNAVVWAGLEDPVKCQASLSDGDEARSEIEGLVRGIEALAGGLGSQFKLSAKQIDDRSKADADKHADLRATLKSICGEDFFSPVKLGIALKRFLRTPFGGKRLNAKPTSGTTYWWVEEVPAA